MNAWESKLNQRILDGRDKPKRRSVRMKWNVGTLDLDWKAANPAKSYTGPANGHDVLAEILDEGGEVLGVWWEPHVSMPGGFARVLYRTPVKSKKPRRRRMRA